MLVLSRRPGEKIYVGDDVVITLVSIQGRNVRLGIDAPLECSVRRKEVQERRDLENRDQAGRIRRASLAG
jgi:carbon storage regulator